MNLIRIAIDRPIAVIAVVLITVMFGIIALQIIPIQLIPDVRRPVIAIHTLWPGAAPAEVEREIVNRQEEVLRGLEGLEKISSHSQNGRSEVILEFSIGTDMDKALLLVSNRLDQVNNYPDEAQEPSLNTAGDEDAPIAWFTLTRMDGNTRPIHTYGDFIEDVIQDRLERIEGISQINVYGGSPRRLEVIVDPSRMAQYGLTVPQIVQALRNANISVSAGSIDEGKRRYIVRSEGELTTPEQVRRVLLRVSSDEGNDSVARTFVRDIAEVRFSYEEPEAIIRKFGEASIALSAVRETGANVIETMEAVKQEVIELNKNILPQKQLILTQVYDETVYIETAIDLVQQNIWVGGSLAALVLLLFLRSGVAALIISLSIPISVIASFVAMAALGRSINVISLAGIAFAVGMVVDAAIVVLENIYRLRQKGSPPLQAAYEGTRQVWSAVLVSALTTVFVFLPILTMKLEVGQIFRDIAVAIAVAVMLSLIVAVTVIPTLSKFLLGNRAMEQTKKYQIPIIDRFSKIFVDLILNFVHSVATRRRFALTIVFVITSISFIATWKFLPELEYLPEGNRNLVFGTILPPPGYNLETMTGIAQGIEREIEDLFVVRTGPDSKPGQPPKIETFFFVALSNVAFLGAISHDPSRAAELIPILRKPVFREPGTFGFITQPSMFGQTTDSGRTVNLDISGPVLESLLAVALRATGIISGILPSTSGHQLRPRPGLELGAPEVRIYPDLVHLSDNGITVRDLGMTVDAFNDGLRVSEITVDGKRIDLILKGQQHKITETQGIGNLPIVTASGTILPLRSLANVEVTSGPTEIRHLERERTITLQIRPAHDLPLEAAMNILQAQVINQLRADGLPEDVRLRLAGTADKLTQAWDLLVWQLLVALIIIYLVMAILFESFVYPLIILFSVPLATAGGVGGLALLNIFVLQPLDMLTMLGFVILLGIVVNNAVLLVHHTIHQVRQEKLSLTDALMAATRDRIRPIFMSTLTSVFGMMPLIIFPGAGSELYRGLGSVVVGGLAMSAILTLLTVPPLLSLIGRMVETRHSIHENPHHTK